MPRGVPKAKAAANEEQARAAEAEKLKRDLAAIPDRDVRIEELQDMLHAERLITDNERINIIVEYACLGQEPKPEKYIGRPRYIKASRHGRTRLAKRSARRDDIPPPEEKMFVYDDEVARFMYGGKYATLRRPGCEEESSPTPKDESMEEDEHSKEHSRDSGCPVSPAGDKRGAEGDKKDGGSSRGSVEKESRKRRSPDLLNEEGNSSSGTSHFIVKGNTPLTVIQKLLERKRLIQQDLRLELIDASAKEILNEDEMNFTVADLANQRGWTRNRPLRILYTITRFTESEDLPVLDVQGRCDAQQQPSPAAFAAAVPMTPTPQHLQHMQHMQHMQHVQHMQHMQQQRMKQQQQQGGYPGQMAIVISEDGTQHMVPYSQLLMQQQDHEGLLKLSTPPVMQAPPPNHRISPPNHHYMGPPPFMGGTPPSQQQMTSSSIFPPAHVIVDNGHGSHLVPSNVSVESVISNPASVKKRQRMAPKRMRERDELMAQKGIEKGTTLDGKGGTKMGVPMPLGNLPGIASIRMPHGCNPSMLKEMKDMPIEAITIDGCSHPTTLRDLPALAMAVSARIAAAAAAPAATAAAVAAPPSSMLTPEERVQETIHTVRSKVAVMHEQYQAERRASNASDAASATASPAEETAPVLTREETEEGEVTPPPQLVAPDTPDSSRSLEIDEMMDESPPSRSLDDGRSAEATPT